MDVVYVLKRQGRTLLWVGCACTCANTIPMASVAYVSVVRSGREVTLLVG